MIKRITWIISIALIVGSTFSWWILSRTESTMRSDLITQAHLAANGINLDNLARLTGTEADLTSLDYLKLKKQLAKLKTTTTNCRFIYLMGCRPDGTVFFFVDNEPVGSEDESPAGQIYQEISPEVIKTFATQTNTIEGPYTDRWGTWTTALIPLIDPQSGELIAVLGMDVDAAIWRWQVVADSALLLGLMLVLLVTISAGFILRQSEVSLSVKPIQHRLLVPLSVTLFFLVSGAAYLILRTEQNKLTHSNEAKLSAVAYDFGNILKSQTQMLWALEDVLLNDSANLYQAIQTEDRSGLLKEYGPLYQQLRIKYGVTHFYFTGSDRVNLLRVHNPGKHGDLIDRFTTTEVERTREPASGIELGPLGTFTLRAVKPIINGGKLIGYLELGKEIEEILEELQGKHEVELAASIFKDELDRGKWESGMKMLGRNGNWDRFTDIVLIYSSISPFPHEAKEFLGEHRHIHTNKPIGTVFNGGRSILLSTLRLFDASEAEVGDLIIFNDTSAPLAALRRTLTIAIISAGVLIILLLSGLSIMLRRVDQSISKHQTLLSEKIERLDLGMSVANDGIWDLDLETNSMKLDNRYYLMAGYQPDEFPASLEELEKRIHFEDLPRVKTAIEECLTGVRDGYEVEFRFCCKHGEYMWIRSKAKIVGVDEWGKPTRLLGTNSDVNEHHRLIEDLIRIQQAVEASSNAISVTTVDGRPAYQNKTFTELFGFKPNENTGADFTKLGADKKTAKMIFNTIMTKGSCENELEMKAKDGRLFPVHLFANAVRNDENEIIGMISVFTDITQRKKSDIQLANAMDESTRINRLMTGRELRLLELKEESNSLLKELGREIKYRSVDQ